MRTSVRFNRFFLVVGGTVLVARRPSLVSGSPDQLGQSELSSRIYEPLRWRSLPQPGDHISHLVVAQHGRFGNMVRQLTNAVAVAHKLGVQEVTVQEFPLLSSGLYELGNGVRLSVSPRLNLNEVTPKRVLAGDFFVTSRLPTPLSIEERTRVARDLGGCLELGMPGQLPGPQDLVIHFRSGDAFNTRPHPNLGQPPLAFYKEVIEALQPKRVFLVFEDRENPVISATESFLVGRSVPVVTQSSSLGEDLAVLLSARSLVASRGTFVESVAMISSNLQTVYVFGGRAGERFTEIGVENVVTVSDENGAYEQEVLRGNWANSQAQRQLMLEHDISCPERRKES